MGLQLGLQNLAGFERERTPLRSLYSLKLRKRAFKLPLMAKAYFLENVLSYCFTVK
jgi:hypothetical protein